VKKNLIRALLLLSVILLSAAQALADGMLIIDYPPEIPPPQRLVREIPPASVKFHKVTVDVNEQVSKTAVDQVFINEFNREMEGTYIFPIPETATISDFAMFIDGKRQSAELMDKDKARNIYEDIVRRKQDPALLEYMGRNLFKARVYPIPANGEKRIQLEYQQVLNQDSGIVKYVYPLNTEKFSSKPLQTVSVMATIKSKTAIKNIYSPSHKIDVKKVSDNEVKISFEESNVKPDKDFILYYTLSDKDLGINVISHKPSRGDGYFMLLASPRVELEKKEKLAKNICFVIDTSGSMSGDKMKQVKNALKFCLNNLEREDCFNIISFATESKLFEKDLTGAKKENIEEALKYVEEMRAIGGTNINEALTRALRMHYEKNMPSFIVFLTDGIPTVDVTDVSEIVKNIEKENTNGVKIFCFGAGTDLNTTLLDQLAADNHGASEYVTENEDIELKISNFFTKIASPVLTDIAVDFGKIKTDLIYPKIIPDLFKGSQIVLLGRYREGGNTAVTLSGKVGDKTQKYANDATLTEKSDDNNFLPRLWAQRRIGFLLEEIRLHGDNKELKDEIVDLSKKHGIMTPYTSFLVLEDDAQIIGGRPAAETRRGNIMLRSEDKARFESSSAPAAAQEAYEQVNVFGSSKAADSMKSESGAGAVHMSRAVKKIQAAERSVDYSQLAPEVIKYVGDKTFLKKGDEWQISSFEESKHEKDLVIVKFGSELYFAMISKYPDAGKFMAIGHNVIFEIDGKFIKISAERGEEKAEKLNSLLK